MIRVCGGWGGGRLGKQHRGCGNTGMLIFFYFRLQVCVCVCVGGGGAGGGGSNPLGSVVSLSKQITFEMLTGM